jgi:FMN reductase
MKIAVVVGNPKAQSRTRRVALAVADALAELIPGQEPDEVLVADLAEVALELFDFESTSIKGLLAAVASSDLLIVASPTYKATYTGLLKVFLDRYGNDGLAGTVGVAVMTGAAPIHALAPEVHLRPLLVELGASIPARGLYVTEAQFDELDAIIASWAVKARPLIDRALSAQ